MTDEDRAEWMARIAKNVRRVLLRRCKGRHLTESDQDWLDLAADAQAVVLFNDMWMKRGVALTEQGIAAYCYACHERDDALAALKITDPYRPRAH
jgi:hypothetical protein